MIAIQQDLYPLASKSSLQDAFVGRQLRDIATPAAIVSRLRSIPLLFVLYFAVSALVIRF